MTTVFTANDKIRALKKKIKFWAVRFSQHKIDSFPLLKEYLESIDGNIEDFDEIYGEIEQNLNEIVPRYYKKKLEARTYANYSDASVEEALLKIANGELSVLAASKKLACLLVLYITDNMKST
ncbi:hypothetical protein QTP88_020379 [Uroleucon formosanum]